MTDHGPPGAKGDLSSKAWNGPVRVAGEVLLIKAAGDDRALSSTGMGTIDDGWYYVQMASQNSIVGSGVWKATVALSTADTTWEHLADTHAITVGNGDPNGVVSSSLVGDVFVQTDGNGLPRDGHALSVQNVWGVTLRPPQLYNTLSLWINTDGDMAWTNVDATSITDLVAATDSVDADGFGIVGQGSRCITEGGREYVCMTGSPQVPPWWLELPLRPVALDKYATGKQLILGPENSDGDPGTFEVQYGGGSAVFKVTGTSSFNDSTVGIFGGQQQGSLRTIVQLYSGWAADHDTTPPLPAPIVGAPTAADYNALVVLFLGLINDLRNFGLTRVFDPDD